MSTAADPWPLCGDCANYRSGFCCNPTWIDAPERDSEDKACSEYVEATS
jgi:hypothetical protein